MKKAKAVSLFLAATILLAAVCSAPVSALRLTGDVNGNGAIDATDYLMIKRTVLRTYSPAPDERLAADVNGNGTIDAADYLMIKRSVLGSYSVTGYVNGGIITDLRPGENHVDYMTVSGCFWEYGEDGSITVEVYNGHTGVIRIYFTTEEGEINRNVEFDVTQPVYFVADYYVDYGNVSDFSAVVHYSRSDKDVWPYADLSLETVESPDSDAEIQIAAEDGFDIWDLGKYLRDEQGYESGTERVTMVEFFFNGPGLYKLCKFGLYETADIHPHTYKPAPALDYELSDDGNSFTVTGIGLCIDKEIAIPSEHNGKPVTRIGYGAFAQTDIEKVTVPSSVLYVEPFAFYKCTGLYSIRFDEPNGWWYASEPYSAAGTDVKLTGDNNGFTDDMLASYWFSRVDGTVRDGFVYKPSVDGRAYAVMGRGDVTSKNIVIPEYYNGLPVESIGKLAFSEQNDITSVTLPDTLIDTGNASFIHCTGLKEIVIPDGTAYIGPYSFSGCTLLESVTIGNGTLSIEEGAFIRCTSLKKIKVPDSVYYVGTGAFFECTKLSAITFGDNILYIGDSAVKDTAYYKKSDNWNSSGLLYVGKYLVDAKASKVPKTVSIKSGTQVIAASTFNNCENLKTVNVPQSVLAICDNAFKGTSLKKAVFDKPQYWVYLKSNYIEVSYTVYIYDFTDPQTAAQVLLSGVYLQYVEADEEEGGPGLIFIPEKNRRTADILRKFGLK